MTTPFRSLPSVDSALSDERLQRLMERYSRQAVVKLVRSQIEDARESITNGIRPPSLEELVSAIEIKAAFIWREWPKSVINATGVILHTNLGRAALSDDAIKAITDVARSYSDLEFDLVSGRRGSRQASISRLICQITGSEAAFVVNNNASAVLLGLAAIAGGKEVIVSRGEAVEIGGGFRIPDVLRRSGATLVEVGTTNRTYVQDFKDAITERTGAFLSVHASNFKVVGFTHSPGLADLIDLGHQTGIPVIHDLGSGCLLDTSQFGLSHEPMPQESISKGVDLAFFSGDKLLGGPQSGIIVGKSELVEAISKHPMARAMRIDKLSMAALHATLLHYLREEALDKIPTWRMIAIPANKVRVVAQRWKSSLVGPTSVEKSVSTIGGGSLPGETLPTWTLCIDGKGIDGGVEGLAKKLRQGNPPVIGRIEGDRILLDPRTVLRSEEEALLKLLQDLVF